MTESDWRACENPHKMLSFLEDRGCFSKRKARLFAVAACRRVWHFLTNERSRQAVEIAERYADGLADQDALTAARWTASQAASKAWRTMSRLARKNPVPATDKLPPYRAAYAVTYAAAKLLNVRDVAEWVTQAAEDEDEVRGREERRIQAALLRDLFGPVTARRRPGLCPEDGAGEPGARLPSQVLPDRPSRLNEERLAEAAEAFLEICPTGAEGGIDKEWLMNDFYDRTH